jgi:metal-sulfur cluster biosynthetic enzyme
VSGPGPGGYRPPEVQAESETASFQPADPGAALAVYGSTAEWEAACIELCGNRAAEVLTALRLIPDPELGINIVDLGLIFRVEADGEEAHITYNLTNLGCGVGPMLEFQMAQIVREATDIEEVSVERIFDPFWTHDRLSPWAREALG